MNIGVVLDVAVKVLVALGGLGGITAFLMVRAQKRKIIADTGKTDAEADSILATAQAKRTDRQLNLLTAYERGVDHMQEQLDEANEKIDKLQSYVEMLIQALRDGGLKVPQMPLREVRRSGERKRDGQPR